MRKQKFWFKNEKEIMKKLGFKPVKGSGSGWVEKEDGENDLALCQLKSTDAESYKINLLDIEKLEYHAALSRKIPVFVIQFLKNDSLYALVNVKDIFELNDCIKNYNKVKESFVLVDDIDFVGKNKITSSTKAKNNFYKEREKEWNKKK